MEQGIRFSFLLTFTLHFLFTSNFLELAYSEEKLDLTLDSWKATSFL